MIVELVIDGGFRLVEWLVTLIPINIDMGMLPTWLLSAYQLLSIGATYVPWDIIVFCIGNILIWVNIHMFISVIRFILDFIPLM